MAIHEPRPDKLDAKATAAAMTPERLREDLAFWSMAAHDARDAVVEAHHAQQAASRRFAEAQEWVETIANELRLRRDQVGAAK